MSSCRLAIADPSLADARGHHFTLTQNLTHGARKLGVEVDWLVHRDFSAVDGLHDASVHPVFSRTMYDQFKNPGAQGDPADRARVFWRELNTGIVSAKLSSSDHILFHTGFGDVFRAALKFFQKSNWQSIPFLHLCTPYDVFTMPGKGTGAGIDVDGVFKAFRNLPALDKKLFLWAETPDLAVNYTSTFGINVRSLPLPPPRIEKADYRGKKSGSLTALYLGAAREEKGFLELPDMVERLYESHGKTGKIRFVIQCTPQIVGYLPSIKLAIDKLSKYPDSYVRLIDSVLSEDEYAAQLNESDVVLLLYNRKNYACRGSGIAVEAVCANKCLLTTSETFCAGLITDRGGIALRDSESRAEALARIADNKAAYMDNAERQGLKYRSAHKADNYVYSIINRVSSSTALTFLPSTIVGRVSPQLLGRNSF